MPAAQVYCTSLSSSEFLSATVDSLAMRAAEKQVLLAGREAAAWKLSGLPKMMEGISLKFGDKTQEILLKSDPCLNPTDLYRETSIKYLAGISAQNSPPAD